MENMIELNRIVDIEIDFSRFTTVCDLVYYDEPLLSYKMLGQYGFLYMPIDSDEQAERIMIIPVDSITVSNYIKKEISLYDIIMCEQRHFVFIEDTDYADYTQTYIIRSGDIPPQYLPEKDVLYQFKPMNINKEIYERVLNKESLLYLEIKLDSPQKLTQIIIKDKEEKGYV